MLNHVHISDISLLFSQSARVLPGLQHSRNLHVEHVRPGVCLDKVFDIVDCDNQRLLLNSNRMNRRTAARLSVVILTSGARRYLVHYTVQLFVTASNTELLAWRGCGNTVTRYNTK